MVKLQSAMEYLMTYGWSILIISVVLGILFQLGVFSSNSLSVRAPPGSCQVFRPSGPGSTININTLGVCSGQLPQYVGVFGASSQITIANNPSVNPNSITISAWVNLQTVGAGYVPIVVKGYNTQYWFYEAPGSTTIGVTVNTIGMNMWGASVGSSSLNAWHHIVFTYNSVSGALLTYLDGVQYSGDTKSGALQVTASSFMLGGGFVGMLSDVQVYNASFDSSGVKTLYQEGIGGVPINLQYLVGWWPLNGDSKDYSGNNNVGTPTGLVFTSQYGK
jgi:hypothetical protein